MFSFQHVFIHKSAPPVVTEGVSARRLTAAVFVLYPSHVNKRQFVIALCVCFVLSERLHGVAAMQSADLHSGDKDLREASHLERKQKHNQTFTAHHQPLWT